MQVSSVLASLHGCAFDPSHPLAYIQSHWTLACSSELAEQGIFNGTASIRAARSPLRPIPVSFRSRVRDFVNTLSQSCEGKQSRCLEMESMGLQDVWPMETPSSGSGFRLLDKRRQPTSHGPAGGRVYAPGLNRDARFSRRGHMLCRLVYALHYGLVYNGPYP